MRDWMKTGPSENLFDGTPVTEALSFETNSFGETGKERLDGAIMIHGKILCWEGGMESLRALW